MASLRYTWEFTATQEVSYILVQMKSCFSFDELKDRC